MKKKMQITDLINLIDKSPVVMKRQIGLNAVATSESGITKYFYDLKRRLYSFYVKGNKIFKQIIVKTFLNKGQQKVDFVMVTGELLKLKFKVRRKDADRFIFRSDKLKIEFIRRSEKITNEVLISKI